ncbi:MAG: ferrochelatase, partial [Thermoguttaceae bacterium]
NHPGFIEAAADRVEAAVAKLPLERREAARLVFTAHGIPTAMAEHAPYTAQLREACRLVADRLGGRPWDLVFQSRSGRPSQAWLEPDIGTHLQGLRESNGVTDVVLAPIGFLSECMELVYDLDIETAGLCQRFGINMVRAAAVGSHPRLVAMIRELVEERFDPTRPRQALGTLGPWPDECSADCCRR